MSERSDIPGVAGDQPTRPGKSCTSPEREHELTVEFFRLVNASDTLQSLTEAAVRFFQQHSQCEAVALRLRRGSEFPYFHSFGFPEQFLVCENDICSRNCFGEIIADSSGAATLECRCGDVIRGRFLPSQPFFTAQGSFWTNHTSQERVASPLSFRPSGCSSRGYESIALIVLTAGKERIGLLQVNDMRAGRFTLEKILFWESLASHLGVALARFSAEETLRESELRLGQAVHIARLGIFEHDHRTGLSHHSPAFRAIYGLDENSQSPQEQVFACVLPEDRKALEEALLQSFDPNGNGLLQREHRILHPSGIRWLLVRAQTFFGDGGGVRRPLRTVGAVIDITASKQSELELTASRQQLRTALDAAKLGVWSRNLETGVITADALARSIYGLPDGAPLNTDSVLEHLMPEDRPRFLEQRAQLEESGICVNSEYRIRTQDEEIRWISIWGNHLHDQSGKAVMITGVIQDITERKGAEQQIKGLEEQFRHAQKMEAVGRLAGAIAHDFNNLLMVIRSYAEILEDCLPPLDPMRRNTQAIMQASDRAASLTGQMLAFSRKQVLSPVALNLNDAVAESAKMLQRLIGEDIELRVKPQAELWTVRADPDQLAQVLMNLSVNSRDACLLYTSPSPRDA